LLTWVLVSVWTNRLVLTPPPATWSVTLVLDLLGQRGEGGASGAGARGLRRAAAAVQLHQDESDGHDGDDEDSPARQVDPLALLSAALRLTLLRDARAAVAILLRPAGFAHGNIVGGFGGILSAFKLRETFG